MSTLGEIGEHAAIRRIMPLLGDHERLVVGAGDDCAVCRSGSVDQVFTTDPIVEGVHFLAGERPERVGNKAAGRVLSDIAAMGAEPRWLLVNVVAPPSFEIKALERIYAGMTGLCDRFGAVIVGGDVARGPVFELHVFGVGETPPGTALLRSGARVGDALCVSGPLGGSLAGKHLDFTPRVNEGLFARASGAVRGMMDLSDGLGTDLRHMLRASGVGGALESAAIPRNGDLKGALYDGEDFELLLAVDPSRLEPFRGNWEERFGAPLAVIGRVTAERETLRLDGAELEGKAFEHFVN